MILYTLGKLFMIILAVCVSIGGVCAMADQHQMEAADERFG